MKILVAPDKFKGSLTAVEAGVAITRGLRAVWPDAEITSAPIADGGEGFAEALGQAQRWFAFRFEGDEAEINVLAPPGGYKPEFDAWRWEALDRTPALIVDFKRPVYQEVVKLFAGFTNSN